MKNMNASRPPEHPPVRGENVKTFSRWDHNRLQKTKPVVSHIQRTGMYGVYQELVAQPEKN